MFYGFFIAYWKNALAICYGIWYTKLVRKITKRYQNDEEKITPAQRRDDMKMKKTLCALLSMAMLIPTISMAALADDMYEDDIQLYDETSEVYAQNDGAVEDVSTVSDDTGSEDVIQPYDETAEELQPYSETADISYDVAEETAQVSDEMTDAYAEEEETLDEAAMIAGMEEQINAAGAQCNAPMQQYKQAASVSSVFSDVSSSAWYTQAIQYVYSNGMMKGTGDGTFQPTSTLTRAEIVQILYGRAGNPGYPTTQKFSDVPKSAWYFKAVQWAASIGVVEGTGYGQFSPNAKVTREQLAVILYHYFGNGSSSKSLSSFADSGKVASWAKTAVRWAVQMNVISGATNGSGLYIKPQGSATRAEGAQMLMNLLTKGAYDVDLQTNYPYSEYNWPGGSGKTIYTSACGPSTMRNILVNLCGTQVTIAEICKLCQQSGARVDGGTLAYAMLEAVQETYGGFTYKYTTDDKTARAHVANGGMALCHTKGTNKVFSTGGHFVAMAGANSSKVTIIDSYITANKWSSYNRSSYITQTALKGVVTTSTSTSDASFDYYYLISKA